MRAVGFRAVCENIALKATERALEAKRATGHPDDALRELARRARDLSKAFYLWTLPPPEGRVDHADFRAYEQLLEDSRALGIEPLG